MTIELDPMGTACFAACEYCLAAGTPVLLTDGRWKPIEDVATGEQVVSFEDEPAPRCVRKFVDTEVGGRIERRDRLLRIHTPLGTVDCTPDHEWLVGRWGHHHKINARDLRPGDYLYWLADPDLTDHVADREFQVGWLAGAILGDGTNGDYVGQRGKISSIKLYSTDAEILQRATTFARDALDERLRTVHTVRKSNGAELSYAHMTRASPESLAAFREAVLKRDPREESLAFARGWLSGFFDAEGSRGDALVMCQKARAPIDMAADVLERFDFDMNVRFGQEIWWLEVRGGLPEIARFATTFRPVLTRKVSLAGRDTHNLARAEISEVEQLPGEHAVYDIVTESKTFVANGFLTWDCYLEPQRDAGNFGSKYDMDAMKAAIAEEVGSWEPNGAAFTLHGGDPLGMPVDDLEEVLRWGHEKWGQTAIQTIGSRMTEHHLDLFERYETHVGVSIDGPGTMNDLRRMRGSREDTREATATTEWALEEMCRRGIRCSVIVVLHRLNVDPEKRDAFKAWITKLDRMGVSGIRFHPMELDHEAESYAVEIPELVAFYLDLHEHMAGLSKLRIDIMVDIRRLLEGDDRNVTCTWNSCYDDKTEVLTDEGFKLFADVDIEHDRIASLDPETGEMTYRCATAKQEYDYVGPMLHWQSRTVNFKVTPDHRMLVYPGRDWRERDLVFRPASDLREPGDLRVKKDAEWSGETPTHVTIPEPDDWPEYSRKRSKKLPPVEVEDYVTFMGWYLSEGSFTRATWEGNPDWCAYRVNIASRDDDVREELKALFRRMGLGAADTGHGITATSRHLYEYVKQFGRSPEKFVPPEIKRMSPDLINRFLRVLFRGDGRITEDGKLRYYRTISERLASDVQELLLKAGMAGTLSVRSVETIREYREKYASAGGRAFTANHAQYRVGVTRDKLSPRVSSGPSEVSYAGKVYDLTVPPNGTLYVRRNGKAAWCSNCDPYTTPAVRGVDGAGVRTNCGRTNKDGVAHPKAKTAGHERQVALYRTPQTHGGCRGCRWWFACKGQCPGEGLDGDWRARSSYCDLYKALFRHVEQEMFDEGVVPLSFQSRRVELEELMDAHHQRGKRLGIHAGLRALEEGHTIAPDGSTHADRPHGDSHGDHTDRG